MWSDNKNENLGTVSTRQGRILYEFLLEICLNKHSSFFLFWTLSQNQLVIMTVITVIWHNRTLITLFFNVNNFKFLEINIQ